MRSGWRGRKVCRARSERSQKHSESFTLHWFNFHVFSEFDVSGEEHLFAPVLRFCIVIIRSAFTGAFYNVKGVPRAQSTRPVRWMDEINLKKLCHSMRKYFQRQTQRAKKGRWPANDNNVNVIKRIAFHNESGGLLHVQAIEYLDEF